MSLQNLLQKDEPSSLVCSEYYYFSRARNPCHRDGGGGRLRRPKPSNIAKIHDTQVGFLLAHLLICWFKY